MTLQRLATEPERSLTESSALRVWSQHVIRDQRAWREIWGRIWRVSSPPALPAVDFAREMVVVAALGEHPTGGNTILVSSAWRTAGRLTVEIRHISLGEGCLVTMAFTQPVDVAIVPRWTGPVGFLHLSEIRNCP